MFNQLVQYANEARGESGKLPKYTAEAEKAIIDRYIEAGHQLEGLSGQELAQAEAARLIEFQESLLKYSAIALLSWTKNWYQFYGQDDACAIAVNQLLKSAEDLIEKDFKYHWLSHLKYGVRAAMCRKVTKRESDLLTKYSYDNETSDDFGGPAWMNIEASVTLDGLYEPRNSNVDMPEAVLDVIKEATTPQEYQFIYDIYFNGETITKAGADNFGFKRMTSSNKHRKILERIKQQVSKKLDITDITEIINLSF